MSLESTLFRKDFAYKPQLIDKLIDKYRSATKVRRQQALKTLIFKMMKDIVKKNINNYLNLLHKTDDANGAERDEVLADCYVIFEKCLSRYITGNGHNFYFYFNKGLSRNFYRNYQHLLAHGEVNIEITEGIVRYTPALHVSAHATYTTQLIMELLDFSKEEQCVCQSKLDGQNSRDFLRAHPSYTSLLYSQILHNIKIKLEAIKQDADRYDYNH